MWWLTDCWDETTPNPAKNRPATNNGMAVETVCRMTPKEKTHNVANSPSLLPMKSASGAAANAPKNVPADKIDTIKDDSDAERAGFPNSSVESVVKTDSQCGMANMPPIVPVSYLINCERNTVNLGKCQTQRVYHQRRRTDQLQWPWRKSQVH